MSTSVPFLRAFFSRRVVLQACNSDTLVSSGPLAWIELPVCMCRGEFSVSCVIHRFLFSPNSSGRVRKKEVSAPQYPPS